MAEIAGPGVQLGLPVQLPDDALFSTFESGQNQELVAAVERLTLADNRCYPPLYLYGAAGQGKTHLLHAACAEAGQQSLQVIYLPLRELAQSGHADILQGLEYYDLVCLDDIDAVSSSSLWAVALFALYNRIVDSGQARLLISATHSPSAINCVLADLRSRLQVASSYAIKKLSDSEQISALRIHAQQRGLHLEADVAQFMQQRLSREMGELVSSLNQLDKASIAQQRRLTVPFVKQVLSI